MLLILLLLLLSLQNSTVNIVCPWRLFGMCYQACKLLGASCDGERRCWYVVMGSLLFRVCFDSMPGLFYFWTLLWCNLLVAASAQRLNIAMGPSSHGPSYCGETTLPAWEHAQMTVQMISWVKLGFLLGTFVCLPDRRIDCKRMQHLCYFSAQILIMIISIPTVLVASSGHVPQFKKKKINRWEKKQASDRFLWNILGNIMVRFFSNANILWTEVQ